jgi:hypothetical protein
MRRGLLVAAAVLVAVLVVAQLALPGLAARRLRSDLEEHGHRVHVDVSAFPAIKLLWGKADRVTATVGDYTSGGPGSGSSLADSLARTDGTDELDVRVAVLDVLLLRMHDVRLRKRGDVLTGRVKVEREDVNAALPPRLHVAGRALGGDALALSGSTSVFGARVRGRARVLLDKGRIIIRPEGIPLASLVSFPIFSDPRVAVDALGAQRAPGGFVLSARGHLRG